MYCYSSFANTETSYCKDGLTFDGLHPNLVGYAILANILNPYLADDDGDPTNPEPTDPSKPEWPGDSTENTQPEQSNPETGSDFRIYVAGGAMISLFIAVQFL